MHVQPEELRPKGTPLGRYSRSPTLGRAVADLTFLRKKSAFISVRATCLEHPFLIAISGNRTFQNVEESIRSGIVPTLAYTVQWGSANLRWRYSPARSVLVETMAGQIAGLSPGRLQVAVDGPTGGGQDLLRPRAGRCAARPGTPGSARLDGRLQAPVICSCVPRARTARERWRCARMIR